MCGRYTLDLNAKRLAEQYGLDQILDELPPRYNVAPGQLVAVVGNKPGSAKRGLAMLNWGLVPRWANDVKSAMKPINARAETLLEKPYFREAFESRRCVIPASGFYEWTGAAGRKQAYLIRLKNDEPMSFAGLWDVWGRGASRHASCCIITVPANGQMREYHERMPALLPSEAIDKWLDTTTPGFELQAWLKPLPENRLVITPVGPAVNSVKNDTPECIAPKA